MDVLRLLIVDMSANTAWVLCFLFLFLGLVVTIMILSRRIADANRVGHEERMAQMDMEHREKMTQIARANPKHIEARRND